LGIDYFNLRQFNNGVSAYEHAYTATDYIAGGNAARALGVRRAALKQPTIIAARFNSLVPG
jgi:hypothetical protein